MPYQVDHFWFEWQVEPYLTTLALYDTKINKKITEDFHFDINEPHIRKIIDSIQQDTTSADENATSFSDFPNDWLSFPKQVNLFHFFQILTLQPNYSRNEQQFLLVLLQFNWSIQVIQFCNVKYKLCYLYVLYNTNVIQNAIRLNSTECVILFNHGN